VSFRLNSDFRPSKQTVRVGKQLSKNIRRWVANHDSITWIKSNAKPQWSSGELNSFVDTLTRRLARIKIYSGSIAGAPKEPSSDESIQVDESQATGDSGKKDSPGRADSSTANTITGFSNDTGTDGGLGSASHPLTEFNLLQWTRECSRRLR
jgi:hypothetical protein